MPWSGENYILLKKIHFGIFQVKKKLIFYNSFSHSKYSHSHQNFVFLILHHFSLIESLLLLLLSHFSRVRLCDPIDVSPPGSPVPGILRARTLEWVAISLTLIRHIQNWAHLYSQAFSFSFSVVSSNTTILWVILSHKYKKHFQFSLGTSCVINHQSLLISLLTVFSPATPLTFSFNNYSLR